MSTKSYVYQKWIPITPLLSSKPSYAIKEFKNLNVKTNSRNVILLNYKLRQYIQGNLNIDIILLISADLSNVEVSNF
jgi:hypothetical protein